MKTKKPKKLTKELKSLLLHIAGLATDTNSHETMLGWPHLRFRVTTASILFPETTHPSDSVVFTEFKAGQLVVSCLAVRKMNIPTLGVLGLLLFQYYRHWFKISPSIEEADKLVAQCLKTEFKLKGTPLKDACRGMINCLKPKTDVFSARRIAFWAKVGRIQPLKLDTIYRHVMQTGISGTHIQTTKHVVLNEDAAFLYVDALARVSTRIDKDHLDHHITDFEMAHYAGNAPTIIKKQVFSAYPSLLAHLKRDMFLEIGNDFHDINKQYWVIQHKMIGYAAK